MQTLPAWFRKFLVDSVETALAAVLALQLVIPQTADEATRTAGIIAAAVFGAVISAFRRAVPSLVAWLREALGVGGE